MTYMHSGRYSQLFLKVKGEEMKVKEKNRKEKKGKKERDDRVMNGES